MYPQPKVSIIVTGKELQVPGMPLQYGQVYESNSFTLAAALQTAGISDVSICYADDDLEQLTDILNNTLSASDVVLLTGGVSVGDYDFVVKAAEACDVKTIFHKVKQRPGKPLFFGKQKEKVVFGLPGNPSSVLTCFYQYVLLVLESLTRRSVQLKREEATLKNQYNKTHQFVHFLKGFYDGDTVEILEAQESYRLRSFAKANCLIELGEASRVYQPGENVFFYLLPV
ncbi:molybdopterin molybdotransferase MoeA [Niabella ginsengisoli]|uniref:Molybdopterin molybdenumtransferase n=1 Tax=Niabella ginsengisoli TaxID=522298 RepID=A0ABS9SJJ6_9BACT|nr:molybdopterin molybdotransferase MoeA [Niabella ginsengisoli]MCH5598558.1 molybdopterin molybdotransferase MoeA [Niabella ginsengisoli]